MRRKIFDGGDLKIYHTKYAAKGGLLAYLPRDLIVEMKGEEIQKSVKSIDIHIDANKPVSYDVKMYSVFDKIKKALGGKKE